MALQRLCPFVRFRHKGVIAKIRNRKPRAACSGGFNQERFQFRDLCMQPIVFIARPAMGGSGNRNRYIGKPGAVQHHQRIPAAA